MFDSLLFNFFNKVGHFWTATVGHFSVAIYNGAVKRTRQYFENDYLLKKKGIINLKWYMKM